MTLRWCPEPYVALRAWPTPRFLLEAWADVMGSNELALLLGEDRSTRQRECISKACAKGKKPLTKNCLLDYPIYMAFWKKQNNRDKNKINSCLSEGQKGRLTRKSKKEFFLGVVVYLNCGNGYMTVYMCQNYRTVHFKRVNFP